MTHTHTHTKGDGWDGERCAAREALWLCSGCVFRHKRSRYAQGYTAAIVQRLERRIRGYEKVKTNK